MPLRTAPRRSRSGLALGLGGLLALLLISLLLRRGETQSAEAAPLDRREALSRPSAAGPQVLDGPPLRSPVSKPESAPLPAESRQALSAQAAVDSPVVPPEETLVPTGEPPRLPFWDEITPFELGMMRDMGQGLMCGRLSSASGPVGAGVRVHVEVGALAYERSQTKFGYWSNGWSPAGDTTVTFSTWDSDSQFARVQHRLEVGETYVEDVQLDLLTNIVRVLDQRQGPILGASVRFCVGEHSLTKRAGPDGIVEVWSKAPIERIEVSEPGFRTVSVEAPLLQTIVVLELE